MVWSAGKISAEEKTGGVGFATHFSTGVFLPAKFYRKV